MKKQLFFIILLGVVELLAGCRPEGKEPETGVSIGLARQRKQDISNLQYRLKFRIPENKQEEVIGKVHRTEAGKSTACRIGFSRRSPQSETTESEWTTGFDPDFE